MIDIKAFKIFLYTLLILSIIVNTIGCKRLIYPSEYIETIDKFDEIKGKLTLNGSNSMAKLCNSLGEAFTEQYPYTVVEKSDTGSGSAVKSVLDGSALIGDLSRNLKDSEKNQHIESRIIALDGIAVVVNINNNIEDISQKDLINIFSGKITNWSELGGNNSNIHLVGREASSGTREGFETALNLIENPPKYNAEYPEAGDIVSKIGNDVNAIGYCSYFSVSGDVKSVKINSIEINEETISDGTYIIQRPFVQIFNKDNINNLIICWFNFIGSEIGKNLIKQEKLVPVFIKPIEE